MIAVAESHRLSLACCIQTLRRENQSSWIQSEASQDADLSYIGVAVAAGNGLQRICEWKILRTGLSRHIGRAVRIDRNSGCQLRVCSAEEARVQEGSAVGTELRDEAIGVSAAVGGLKYCAGRREVSRYSRSGD